MIAETLLIAVILWHLYSARKFRKDHKKIEEAYNMHLEAKEKSEKLTIAIMDEYEKLNRQQMRTIENLADHNTRLKQTLDRARQLNPN